MGQFFNNRRTRADVRRIERELRTLEAAVNGDNRIIRKEKKSNDITLRIIDDLMTIINFTRRNIHSSMNAAQTQFISIKYKDLRKAMFELSLLAEETEVKRLAAEELAKGDGDLSSEKLLRELAEFEEAETRKVFAKAADEIRKKVGDNYNECLLKRLFP
jgi:hypothetical protein